MSGGHRIDSDRLQQPVRAPIRHKRLSRTHGGRGLQVRRSSKESQCGTMPFHFADHHALAGTHRPPPLPNAPCSQELTPRSEACTEGVVGRVN
jgi:hypothetical protein